MKFIFIFLFVSLAGLTFGQEKRSPSRADFPSKAEGERNNHGQKIGIWTSHWANGEIHSKLKYEPVTETFPQATEEDFFYGRSHNSGNDTTIYKDKLIWSETYEPSRSGASAYLYYTNHETDEAYIAFGTERLIRLESKKIERLGRSGEIKEIQFQIQNLSDEEIEFHAIKSPDCVTVSRTTIKHNSKSDVKGTVKLEAGKKEYLIYLESDSIIIPFRLETYGYDIRSEDIGEIESIKLPEIFTYYRTRDEALINILDTETNKILKRIPLSYKDNTIDLTALKKKECKMEIVNYSSERKNIVIIQLEK